MAATSKRNRLARRIALVVLIASSLSGCVVVPLGHDDGGRYFEGHHHDRGWYGERDGYRGRWD